MSELEDAIVQARRDVWRCIDAYSQGATQAAELNIHAALARLERLVRLDATAQCDCENPSTTCYCRVCTINWHGDNDYGKEPPPCHGIRLCSTCQARAEIAEAVK